MLVECYTRRMDGDELDRVVAERETKLKEARIGAAREDEGVRPA
jgi:hypothetical protein